VACAFHLELGGLNLLMADLCTRGIVTKVRSLKTRRSIGGSPFTRGPLAHLLRNRFYIGEVAFKGEILSGEQPTILDRDLFDPIRFHVKIAIAGRGAYTDEFAPLFHIKAHRLKGRIEHAGVGSEQQLARLVFQRLVSAQFLVLLVFFARLLRGAGLRLVGLPEGRPGRPGWSLTTW